MAVTDKKIPGTLKSSKSGRWVKAAVAVTGLIILIHGIVYYALAARLEGPAKNKPIAPDSLNIFPFQIADWTGKDIPIDETVIPVMGAEAYINRLYSRQGSTDCVMLFVACNFSTFDKVIHRPEICYPAAGWKLIDDCSMQLQDSIEKKLPCTFLKYSKGEVETERASVLHYYIVDGQPHGNIPVLQPRLWRALNKVDYIARVLISTSDNPLSEDSGQKVVSDFAIDSAPFIARMFSDIQKDRKSDGSPKTITGN